MGLLSRMRRRPGERRAPGEAAPPSSPSGADRLPPDFDAATAKIVEAVRAFTMTSPERVNALCDAVRYLVRHGIEGDVVECGVWRGGSSMAAALALAESGDVGRGLHLFDTFAGMPAPGPADRRFDGTAASELLSGADRSDPRSYWCIADEDDVRANLAATGYPSEKIHLVPGLVEETVPARAPERIALLRLDTDWYESTRHGLISLFPRLVPGGVLIIDDYGYWDGARRAVDEFVGALDEPLLLNRVDDTGRIGVRLPARG